MQQDPAPEGPPTALIPYDRRIAKREWKAAIREGARAEAREAAIEPLRIRDEDPESGGRQANSAFIQGVWELMESAPSLS